VSMFIRRGGNKRDENFGQGNPLLRQLPLIITNINPFDNPPTACPTFEGTAALQLDATLVHKDPEFESLNGLVEERLPYKQ